MNNWKPIETAEKIVFPRILLSDGEIVHEGYWSDGWVRSDNENMFDAKYWMLLPEPPCKIQQLKEELAELDAVINEYNLDIVGTGSTPSKKEQTRVNKILEKSFDRHEANLLRKKNNAN